MTPGMRRAALLLCCGLASCIVQPRDPFVAAERAMQRDDLLSALQAYDAVPVSHPRYPDARAAAVEIESRMRRCHELILEALVMRGEWRDEEALEALRKARTQWPQQPSIERWIVATEQRRKLFATREQAPKVTVEPGVAVTKVQAPLPAKSAPKPAAIVSELRTPTLPAGEQASTGPVVPRDTVPTPVTPPRASLAEQGPPSTGAAAAAPALPVVVVGAAPGGESKPTPTTPPPSTVTTTKVDAPKPVPVSSARATDRVSVGEDPVALDLISVEGRLGRGEFRQAVDDLVELARRFPSDLRVCQRLVPLLKQRALLSYGDGAVAAAVADWRRVLELQPDEPYVPSLIERALRESERR